MTQMPVLFIGHGSPMNALANNAYTRTLKALGESLPRPKCILAISAHWQSEGSGVTEALAPKTIHDFGGFPKPLFEIQYPAPGSPEVAKLIQETIKDPPIQGDSEQWGLDHGTWSVLIHMYPRADIPVVQLSLDMLSSPEYHFLLGQKLRFLRSQGVLIFGSGNLVHNLRRIRWEDQAQPFEWAIEFDEWIKGKLLQRDHQSLVSDFRNSEAGRLSVPTLDHYLPALYVLGAADADDRLNFEYEEIQNGSISMRSFSLR